MAKAEAGEKVKAVRTATREKKKQMAMAIKGKQWRHLRGDWSGDHGGQQEGEAEAGGQELRRIVRRVSGGCVPRAGRGGRHGQLQILCHQDC